MTNQTPEQDQAQVNAVPWTNGKGLVTGATILALLSAIIGTFYLYGPLAGTNTWTGTNTFSVPIGVASGGCGATTAAGCRTNISAAASGANSDITALNALTAINGGAVAPIALSAPLVDASAVTAQPSTFWYPTYNTTGTPIAAVGRSYQFPRLQIGVEAASSQDEPQTIKSWVGSLQGLSNIMGNSMVAITTSIGNQGITVATRSSDALSYLPSGEHSGGSQAVNAIVNNDDDTGGNPIVCGFCSEAYLQPNVNGVTLNQQLDIMNLNSLVQGVNVFTGVTARNTIGTLYTAGAYVGAATVYNASAAVLVGPGQAGATQFEKGEQFLYNSLNQSNGAGGNGIAIEMASGSYAQASGTTIGQSVRWVGQPSSGVFQVNGEIWSTLSGGLIVQGNGSGADFQIRNSALANVLQVLHGTTNLNTYGNIVSTGLYQIGSATAIPAGGSASLGYKATTTANFGVYFGSGVPTLSAAQGSLYLRSDGSSTSTRLYVNTNGTTGWTNVTTGS